jgi:hypothetical protein
MPIRIRLVGTDAVVRYHRTNGHHHDVHVLGIDLAAEAKATRAVLIARGPSAWSASEVSGRLDDDAC